MEEDILMVETYMDSADIDSTIAFYKLRELLLAWDNNLYIEEHTKLRKELKVA